MGEIQEYLLLLLDHRQKVEGGRKVHQFGPWGLVTLSVSFVLSDVSVVCFGRLIIPKRTSLNLSLLGLRHNLYRIPKTRQTKTPTTSTPVGIPMNGVVAGISPKDNTR